MWLFWDHVWVGGLTVGLAGELLPPLDGRPARAGGLRGQTLRSRPKNGTIRKGDVQLSLGQARDITHVGCIAWEGTEVKPRVPSDKSGWVGAGELWPVT